MRKKIIGITLLLLAINFLFTADTIEQIVLEGNKKVSRDTILFYMKSREGGLFSREILRDDFQALWKTGFFENITIESKDGQSGKIVEVKIKENLLISTITYKTGKKIKETDIVEKLQENNIVLMPFSYYSPAKLKKVERIIKDMLIEKGYSQGKVNISTNVEKDQIALTIQVVQGPKTRIGWIDFTGIEGKHVSANFLRSGMKSNKVHSLLSILGGKDVYSKEKIDEDLEEVKLRLQQKGYLEAKVGKPTLSMARKRTVFGKPQKMMKISIPVQLGPRYRLGDVNVDGNKVIRTAFIKAMLSKLKQGKIYNIKKRNKIIENIQKIYGSLGYIYAQIAPVENLDPVKKIADLTLKIHEGEIAYVGKLEFKGNTFTRDHVIRREWFLREGGRLNMNFLETSITRMKQLGLVTIEKMPEIKPNPEDPQKVDIIAEVKELNRQMVNFNVGYSGFDGWFIALGYSTQNFMGMGETLALNLQTGTRSKQYRLAFTEPYLFNLPGSLGFSVHKTSLSYPYLYTRKGEGFNLSTSFRFWRYYGASLFYSFENVEISDVQNDLFTSNPYYYFYYGEGKRTISSIAPTFYYSTVDSPIFPSRGTKYLLNYRFSGSFLGGDVDMHKTKAQFVKFIPVGKRHTLGFQLVHQSIIRIGDNPIPIYEKFFLGGEQSIRGFDIYRIGPRNENGTVIGGNKAFFANFEYQIPLNQQFSFVFYYDVGNAYDFGEPISLKNVYSSMGLELKIFVPMLNVPFRLIFAYNPRKLNPNDSNLVFRFAVGPSFN
jgi:outer membrane protein insertion porin family